MAPTISGNYDALAWVQDELQKSLADALQALTHFVELPEQTSTLEVCIAQLHQVSGTVDMLNLTGAQMLASEMLTSASMLRDKQHSQQTDIQDSLLESLLLLANYLPLLGANLEDHPLRLITTINELRRARGETEISHNAVFKPKLSINLPSFIAPNADEKIKPNIRIAQDKVSHVFQISLLDWFKNNDQMALHRIADILHYLRLCSEEDRSIILWWSAEGVIEALLDGGLDSSSETKLKIGQLHQAIKTFTHDNEQHLQALFPTKLVTELLLLVAKANTSGKHVFLLKNTFKLDFFAPEQHQKIYSLSSGALTDAHTELLNQLQEAKEHIDQFDRDAENAVESMKQLPQQLSSMASTLELLAENASAALLQEQAESFTFIADQQEAPDHDLLMSLADDLIQIETQLQKNAQFDSAQSIESTQLHNTVISECQNDLNNVKESLSVLLNQTDNTSPILANAATQLQLISGTLAMINLSQVASLFENTSSQMTRLVDDTHSLSEQELNWFADIIAFADLYMDNIRQSGTQLTQLLIDGQSTLLNFNQLSPLHHEDLVADDDVVKPEELVTAQQVTPYNDVLKASTTVDPSLNHLTETRPDIVSLSSVQQYINNLTTSQADINSLSTVQQYINNLTTNLADTESLSTVQQYINNLTAAELHTDSLSNVQHPIAILNQSTPITTISSVENYIQNNVDHSPEIQPETGVDHYISTLSEPELELGSDNDLLETKPEPPSFAEDIDPEIAEIFIEEANEVVNELKQLVPLWQQQHKTETLAVIRRHFHTLKGSGNMAGATIISDLSWSVEHLLNLSIDDSAPLSPEIDLLLSDTYQLIPGLLTDFKQGNLIASEEVNALIRRANSLSETETETETETELSLSDDDELQQIFIQEAIQHLACFKQAFEQASLPFSLNKELLRAAHSLKGCANIAQVMPVAAVATQLDQSLRIIYENKLSLDQQQLALLTATIEGLDQFIDHLQTPLSDEPDILPLLDNLTQITADNQRKQADEQEKLIDPEFLVVYLEETDELLSQYTQQLDQRQQQADNEQFQQAIKNTLSTLIENSHHAKQATLAELYQLLSDLAQQDDINNDMLVKLLEHGYEEINNQIESLIQNKPPADISAFKHNVNALIKQLEQDSIAAEAKVDIVAPAPEWFAIPNEDPELLAAFTEECGELLESSDNAIANWQKDYHDSAAAKQLQRDLHTIKGSARLTNLQPIADLTHHTESLVFVVADQKQEPNTIFFTLLQRCQDRLSEMQELLATKEKIPFALDLLADIGQFTGQAMPQQATLNKDSADQVATETSDANTGGEQIRIRADLLDFLTNFTGEVNISRDRVGQKNASIKQQLIEMESTVSRLRDQLRNLEIETETQILFRYEDESKEQQSDFDPLEFDRFSMIQQLSRSLTESVSDMSEINQSIDNLVIDSDAILLQQSRLSADLDQGLMNTRLLPFTGLVPRFERIIRQVNSELGKQASLTVHGADRELDRTILDRIVSPLEHLIRNAIAHGIESPEIRAASGKTGEGQLSLTISREGSEILLSLADDGQGINVEKVRQKALDQQLINPDHMPSDEELIQLILSSGFSTADSVSQLSGRGVGMDVVSNEIRALKGRLSIQSVAGQGTTFNIRLPLTLSIMQSLMVSSHDEQFAIPLTSVHAGDRISIENIQTLLDQNGEINYEFNGEYYRFYALAHLLDKPLSLPDNPKLQLPVLLFRYGDMNIALLVDSIDSNREIVLKSMGEQLSHIDSVTGATILGDGQVVFILDIPALVNSTHFGSSDEAVSKPDNSIDRTPIAMVVDDSITMRKVSGNLLKRHGFDVITARDGIDAVAQLNEQVPDIILLDVEMPRMDGFEFATLIRNSDQYEQLPIIMITSRTGDKHRSRAKNIGVNAYLGKPYQELELVETMQDLLGNHYPHAKQ